MTSAKNPARLLRECAKLDIEEEQRLAEIGEYWDTHSLADHWDETSEVEFEVTAARRHRIALEPEIYERIEVEAELRGVVPEKLANSILKERLGELASR